jgi:hypothetical protein
VPRFPSNPTTPPPFPLPLHLPQLYGTSASSPVVAGMVSLVNAQRIEAGKPPLGFLNPAIYQAGASTDIFTDVTEGQNNCCGKLIPIFPNSLRLPVPLLSSE